MATSANIGEMIRFHRRKSGLSRIELADLAGVGKTVIFDIEANKQTVKCSTLRKVLHVLNIRIEFEGPLMNEYEKLDNAKS